MNSRKLVLSTLATLCVVASFLAFASASAFAIPTHVFSKSFGAGPCVVGPSEPCDGKFSAPDGVAVNELTGDIYVVDKGNNRIEYFSSEGVYEGEFNGSGENAVEVTAAPTGRFSSPESIAVDNNPVSPSFGDVYVADYGHSIIDKFSSTGEYVGQLTESAPGTHLEGELYLATSPSGELWVEQNVEEKPHIFNYSGARTNTYIGVGGGPLFGPGFKAGVGFKGIAANSVDDFYPSVGLGSSYMAKYTSSGELIFSTEIGKEEPVTGIAVESSSDSVYFMLKSSGNDVGNIERFSSNGFPVENFGSEQLTSGSGVAVSSATGDVYVTDAAKDLVDVYVDRFAAPTVEAETFSNVTARKATVGSEISTNGLETTYAIEYGTSEAYGSTVNESPIAGSFAGAALVSVTFESVLQSETTYHFRVVAINKDGTAYGADKTFTTLSDLIGPPDGRGYELVSHLASADATVYPLEQSDGFSELRGGGRASADGDAAEFVADRLATGGASGGNTYVAVRDSGGGWSSPTDLSTPGFDGVPFEALFSDEFSNSGTSLVPVGSHVLSSSAKGLFDSVGGRLAAVSVLPEGNLAPDASFGFPSSGTLIEGGAGQDLNHVISADGSRIFWIDMEAGSNKEHVFVREDDSRTVAVSLGAAHFWAASPDGRYAFYTEDEKLLRFDVESGSREELVGGSGAGVLGVIGINETGEDGSYVYFMANGILGNGAEHGAVSGNCAVSVKLGPGECNLYVQHDGVIMFIAALHPAVDQHKNATSYQVASDGHAVVFESADSLTGYDNNGIPEAFVYNIDANRMSCASCNPTGTPAAVLNPSQVLRGGGHRWISEDGTRVFFESKEALVAQDTNGERDVYEWEQDGAGSCQNVKGCVYLLSGGTSTDSSYFLDASASGNDVFMVTRAELVPQDQGDTFEVYDARVGAEEPVGESACTGTGCQGLPAPPPIFATPSSVTFAGVGNFSPGTGLVVKARAKTKVVKCPEGYHKHNGKCVRSSPRKPKARKSIHGKGSK